MYYWDIGKVERHLQQRVSSGNMWKYVTPTLKNTFFVQTTILNIPDNAENEKTVVMGCLHILLGTGEKWNI